MKKERLKEPYNIACGERLRQCRNERGLTQLQLAEAVDALPENRSKRLHSPQHIGQIENGWQKLTRDYAHLLALVLEVRAEYLLCVDNYKTNGQEALGSYFKDAKAEQKKRDCIVKLLALFSIKLEISSEPRTYEVPVDILRKILNIDASDEEYKTVLGVEGRETVTVFSDEDGMVMYKLSGGFLCNPVYMSDEELTRFTDSLYKYVNFTIRQHICQACQECNPKDCEAKGGN